MTQRPAPPAETATAPDMRSVVQELFTLRRDPLPRMSRPRWLARLPHVVVLYAAVFFGFLTNLQLGEDYDVTGGPSLVLSLLTGVSIALALSRPVAAWWLGLVTAALTAWTVRVQQSQAQSASWVPTEYNPWGAHAQQWHNQAWPWTAIGYFAFAPLVLLVSLRVPPRVTAVAVGVPVVCTGLAELLLKPLGSTSTFVISTLLFGIAGLVGYAMRAVRLARGQLVVQETLTEEERARRTLLEERSRIARELHDVVAHHMSVISIQAQVAPHLVENPSEELKENLAGIRENAVEALTELRRVLGVLRSEHPDDPAGPHHPQPTLAELDGLVDNVRGAGLEVTTEFAGIRRPLTPGVELTAYRIVQEALSNCLRHAPGSRVEVGIAYGPRELHLSVANSAPTRTAPPSPGAGHGLLGMRERAGMLGGELAAGPRPGGGYEVSAVLPMDPPGGSASSEPKKDI
ncbi:sensor histidine kinase [Streptomyces sp. NBC_00249]|uniref:sensor histidine kinase n=1 Tax=Streptomyces sp. NBC_00249 TaxID=2975690 RepID=UPI00225AD495|nr:sensor histidine kinase [Streptomyces sp. NBC_00249]MCX5196018.1 sensor histidine kinase [Streptomyces sp. NBC_00249]